MNLERMELVRAFREFAASGHGVLIGAPGVGKTHLLRGIAAELQTDPRSVCLFLPADRMPFESDADLRAELDVTGDLLTFLEEQTRDRHGYLIVDALDAVRGDRPRTFALGLVRRVLARMPDSWSVVLSMRTYDALRSVELDELLPSASDEAPEPQYRLPGAVCRHFYLPPLSDTEIAAATEQLPWLAALLEPGHDDLRELLRIPFNLWLLERLLDRGTDIAEVSPIQSEVQLLDLFWRQRVRSGPLEPDQRRLTARAAEAMVRQRTLWANRNDVSEPGANAGWIALHSSEVLQDSSGAGVRVSFGHNVLFDYAVSVEILDDDASSILNFLREEPDRTLFLRPTLNYFFARLWFYSRALFWEIFWALLNAEEPQVRLVAQVLPPGIVAGEVRSVEDAEPLFSRLERGAAYSEDAVLHVLRAIRTRGIVNDEVWSAFAARCAPSATRVYSWDLARFLSELLERDQQRSEPNTTVRENVSVGARSLLRLALTSPSAAVGQFGAAWLIDVVARTYSVDQVDARSLFEMILSRIADPNTPVDLIYRLANAVQGFWNEDPEFAASIYAATFARVEESEEPTYIGGIVLALRSTRRQDFELAKYVLLEHAPQFLRQQPRIAMGALAQAATGAAATDEYFNVTVPEETFDFRGRLARYRQDNSHFWDAPGTVQGNAHKLLDVILAYLAELPAGSTELAESVDVIADDAVAAFIWRGLLRAGAQAPEKYASLLYELLSAKPVLSHPETAPEAAAFLAAAAPLLENSELRRIEDAIVELAVPDPGRGQHWARRLIAQIPENRLTTIPARALRTEALGDPDALPNQPLVSFSTIRGAYGTEDWLRDEGIETESSANKRLLAATDTLQQFASQFMNQPTVPDGEVAAITRALAEALELLHAQDDVPAPLLDTVWARVGDAAATAALAETLDGPTANVLRTALLACASGDAPRPAENADEAFTVAAWSPAARNAAAQGIPRLVRHRTDSELASKLRALAADPAPSVRFLLAAELQRLIPSNEDSFWALIGLYASEENNGIVLQALGGALMAVASSDREELVTGTLDQLLRRIPLADLGRSLPNEDRISALIVGLAVGRKNQWAQERINEAVRDAPLRYLSTLVLHLLHYVNYSRIADPNGRAAAETALGWLSQIIERVHRTLRDTTELAQDSGSDREEEIRELFNILDHIISRFYFQSGVYNGQGEHRATQQEICSFFALIRPHLRQLSQATGGENGFGLPARTAHHFVELLRGSVGCDPPEVLHLTRLAVDSARGSGYAFDGMAAQEVTAIVETVLADHRESAAFGQPLDDLVHVLNAFVQAGWPEAQRLVWRLEELFR